MHYKEMLRAAELFKIDEWAYDAVYTDAKNAINWQSLHLYSTDVIRNVVLVFSIIGNVVYPLNSLRK